MKKIIRLTESDLTRIVRRVIKEFDYDEHKRKDIEIIDRVKLTINPGSPDVIEVEGLLGESSNQEHIWFKPLEEPKIYESSNSVKLIKDQEISISSGFVSPITRKAAELLSNNIGNWLGISSEGVRLYGEINFGENIDTRRMGLNYIGNLDLIIMNIRFDKI